MKTGCCTGLTFWLDAQEEVPSISSGMGHLSQPTMTDYLCPFDGYFTQILLEFSQKLWELCLQVCSSYNDSNIELKEISKATFIAQVGTGPVIECELLAYGHRHFRAKNLQIMSRSGVSSCAPGELPSCRLQCQSCSNTPA